MAVFVSTNIVPLHAYFALELLSAGSQSTALFEGAEVSQRFTMLELQNLAMTDYTTILRR